MQGFPALAGSASGKEPTCQCRRRKRWGFNPWVRKIPWRRSLANHSTILGWRTPWTEEPGSYSPWGCKELDTAELLGMKVKVKLISHVWLFVNPWTVAHQVPLSMGFSRQENWSGLPFPSPGDLSDPGIEPQSPALQEDALTSEPPGKPTHKLKCGHLSGP